MADAGAGRHHAEVVEGALAPLEEVIALAVALVLVLDVVGEGLRRAELVDDHRMVDDEIDGDERVDLLRVAAEALHAVAHGGEVDDGRHAGEVLHEDARGRKPISVPALPLSVSQAATASMSALVTERPSSWRKRFSSSTFMEKGSLEMPLRPFFSASGSE